MENFAFDLGEWINAHIWLEKFSQLYLILEEAVVPDSLFQNLLFPVFLCVNHFSEEFIQ